MTHAYQDCIHVLLRELGIAIDTIDARCLPLCGEAGELITVQTDADGREHQLIPAAAAAWRAMQAAAREEDVQMRIVSAYRSVERQAAIIRRKLEQGQSVDRILAASAPPGYSEHHTGRAVDIGTAGMDPLEEIFEQSEAFAWLTAHAGRFGFHLSYPRNNSYGYCYEPWHWLYRDAADLAQHAEQDGALPEAARRVAGLLRALGHRKPVVMLPESGKTSAEAAAGLGCDVAQIAKSIVFRRLSDDAAVMVVASGANRVDEHKVAALVGALGKADARFVRERIGYAIGGVSPIGHAGNTVMLIDRDLLALDSIWAAAGHPHAVFNMTPQQLLAMTGAPVADVALR